MSSTFGLTRTRAFAFVVGLMVLPLCSAVAVAAASAPAPRVAVPPTALRVNFHGDPQGGFQLDADVGRNHVLFTNSTVSGAHDPVLEIDLPGLATGSVHFIGRAPYLSGTIYLLGLPVSLHGVPGRDLSWWVEAAAKAPAGR
jgi:hypothetical protein